MGVKYMRIEKIMNKLETNQKHIEFVNLYG